MSKWMPFVIIITIAVLFYLWYWFCYMEPDGMGGRRIPGAPNDTRIMMKKINSWQELIDYKHNEYLKAISKLK